MERSRRSAKVAPHAKFAELRKLRESGKTRLSTYEVEAQGDLYEEVDEEAYKKVVKNRLMQDDFVVDDGGEGYVDNGMDDWGDEGRYSSEEEDTPQGKSSKRKREEEEERKKKQEGDISSYFNRANAVPVKAKKVTLPTADDKNFVDELFGELDDVAPVKISHPTKKRTEEPARKTRRLSPPRKDPKTFKPNVVKHGNNLKMEDNVQIASSPPPLGEFDYNDESFVPTALDEDVVMSDAAIPPSSPAANAAERKQPITKVKKEEEEEEEDDELPVEQIKGSRAVHGASVNISASRPTKAAPLVAAKSSPAPALDIDSSAWTSVSSGLNVTSSPAPERATLGKLPSTHAVEEDGSVKMFWMDYTEINGALFLFGKVKDNSTGKFVSAFLKVDGIMRNLFFLPREKKTRLGRQTDEEVEMGDVHEEVSELFEKRKVDNFKAKSSERKYAFEVPGIPRQCDYLKVLYPYTSPQLPTDLEGETFSQVFGTNTALFEQFVLCRNIMGPCWLKIEGADFSAMQGASWCKLEMQVNKPQQITPIGDSDSSEAPPLTLMSIALRTIMNVKENKQEIIAISCRIYENVRLNDPKPPEELPCQIFTVVRPVHGTVYPAGFDKAKERHKTAIRAETSEKMLLSSFLAKLQNVDPDVLIGHQLENVDYSILIHRLKENKTHHWSRIGRMKRSQWPQHSGRMAGSFFAERQMVSGRLMCDLANDLGKSLMTKCQSWSLAEMCDLMLGTKRQELDNEDALKTWATASGKGYLDYLAHCEVDTYFIAAIAIKIQMLPLTKQLTNLAGNSWARTMSGTRAERNEYILLHEFYRNKYLCPDKVYGKPTKTAVEDDELNPDDEGTNAKKKDKYKGGLVFDPKKGLYDRYILVMDFNSLYPSIIQEYNICFTTVDRSASDEDKVPEVPEKQDLGILPKLISTLVKRRQQVKGLMKDKNATVLQQSQWDIKQMALKLTANSMYGCLGYTRSRFYARPLAMLTTSKGRDILQSTKDLAESMQLEVIYGDTDSVMINTMADNYADALKMGNEFKKQVNGKYRLLEIDIDNVFQRLLLHAKKKYAALNCVVINGKLDTKMEVKGLDMRRREYCQLSKDASTHILNEVFTGDEKEVVVERIHEYLRDLSSKIREGKFPAVKYTIYTRLGKNPEDYPNGKTMPQVQVALRKKARGEPVKSGDVISYIITGDGSVSDQHAAERAYATQDVLKPGSELKPDPEWYLVKQIFPPIERLCGPIDGTDSLRLAECLGLDTRKYQIVSSLSAREDREIHPLESTIPDEERFRDAARLSITCRSCKEAFTFGGLVESQAQCSVQGITCPSTSCAKLIPVGSIGAQLECQIRSMINKYYDAWLVCSDCKSRTRQMSVYGKRCPGPKGLATGCKGVMAYEYTDKMLYNQLLYFLSIFDVEKAKIKAKLEERDTIEALAEHYRARYEVLRGVVDRYLEKCGRQWVSMESIFGATATS